MVWLYLFILFPQWLHGLPDGPPQIDDGLLYDNYSDDAYIDGNYIYDSYGDENYMDATASTTETLEEDTAMCECVPSYLCDNGAINTEGSVLLNPRTIPVKKVKTCPNPMHTCCPTTTTTTHITSHIPECSKRNRKGTQPKILGFRDNQSQFGEFPWVAAVLREELVMEQKRHLFVAGGTLIHPRVVLTAAHNIHNLTIDELLIRLGEWDTQTVMEPLEHQDIEVERVVINPWFEIDNLKHDVALLFLKEEAATNDHIQKICLANDTYQVDPNDCVINGWGKNGFDNDGQYQTIMKSITLPLVNVTTCQTQLRKTRLGSHYRLHESFICAGGEAGQDGCKGDGGGPLACAQKGGDKDTYLLVGITAWGMGCGNEGVPGVYVDVPLHFDWINGEIDAVYPTNTKASPTIYTGVLFPDISPNNGSKDSSNLPTGETDNFLVTVKTGYGTDAGSNSSLVFLLEDENSNQITNLLSIPKQDETVTHRIPIPNRFGGIVTLRIALDYKLASDWYCEDIFVEDPRLNDRLYFPIDRRIQGNQFYEFQNYATCLPQFDLNNICRRLTLQKKREDYELSFERPVAMVKDLPKDEIFHQDYYSSLIAINKASKEDQEPLLSAWQSSNNISAFFGGDFYMPQSMKFWKEDTWFGAQRVQGVLPNIIELCNQIPDKLGVTEDTVSGLLEGTTLKQALKNNKIFITDLEILDGIPHNDNKDIAAPIAIFYLNKRNQLMPIAIQLRQQKGPYNPVYTPKDQSNTWLVAKIYYNNAEAQFHQYVAHFGYTHAIVDGIATSMNRQLSPSHPVFKILKPHFLYLLAINRLSKQALFVPHGVLPLFSMGLEGLNPLLAKAIPQFTFARAIGSVESDARARSVWDKQVLPYYPFRDDAHSMYNIIKKYVTTVITYYYNTPEKIVDDWELQMWRAELSRPRALGGVGILDLPGSNTAGFRDINEIIDLVTMIISHSSVGHAAVNYPQYDAYGFFPNYPSNLNEGPPPKKRSYTEDEVMSLFPSGSQALRVRAFVKTASWQGTNDCGDFEKVYLYDPVSQKAQEELRKDLAMLSKKIMKRNSRRVFSYKYLDPNYVPNAISA